MLPRVRLVGANFAYHKLIGHDGTASAARDVSCGALGYFGGRSHRSGSRMGDLNDNGSKLPRANRGGLDPLGEPKPLHSFTPLSL